MKTYEIHCYRNITESVLYEIPARDLEEAEQIASREFACEPDENLTIDCRDSDVYGDQYDEEPDTGDGPRPRRHD